MPLFNPMFAYLFFHAFQRFSNLHRFLGPRVGQSYPCLLNRKYPLADGELADEFMINEHTISLFHLYVASCLDAGVGERRQKLGVYTAHVNLLKRMDGKDGARDWRAELGELLDKWHPIFAAHLKRKRVQRMPDECGQRLDAQVDPRLL